jgi:hypothetical protein
MQAIEKGTSLAAVAGIACRDTDYGSRRRSVGRLQ